MQDEARTGTDGNGQTVGDGVVDGKELALETAQLGAVSFLDLLEHRHDAVLLELLLDQGEREPGSHQRDVGPLAQQVRHTADVVLVAVGEDHCGDLVQPIADPAEVRQDHVDAGLVLLGEEHPAVHDQQRAVVLEDGHVATDLAEAAQTDDPEPTLRELGGLLQLGVRMTHGVSVRLWK